MVKQCIKACLPYITFQVETLQLRPHAGEQGLQLLGRFDLEHQTSDLQLLQLGHGQHLVILQELGCSLVGGNQV
jgi:hypothetical protein